MTYIQNYAYISNSSGTISIRDIIDYVEEKTEKARYHFSKLKDWIYELIDYYIEWVNKDN